jgi:cellulose synthase/poly-beta-1,6-N-acetylglucosamine synthase-like glycosyltransferase
MAFDYELFKGLISGMKAVGGFDKELELELFKKHIKIEYIENAWVEDEKVQNAQAFKQQRKRWLSAQWNYLRNYAFKGLALQLKDLNLDYLDKVYQLILPPRIVLLGLLTVISLFTVLMSFVPRSGLADHFLIGAFPWIVTWFLAMVSLLLSVPKDFSRRKIFFAVRFLPWGFYLMLISTLRLKGVNKRFLHTNHTFGSDKLNEQEQDNKMRGE